MPMEKSPPELVARFGELAGHVPDAQRRQMFGYPTCVVGGNMFMGLHADKMVLRLGDADRATMIERHGAHTFEPMPGRPMREYVVVPPAIVADDKGIEPWIERAFAHAAALPPKSPKPKTASKSKATPKAGSSAKAAAAASPAAGSKGSRRSG